jgi:hypothetical protein
MSGHSRQGLGERQSGFWVCVMNRKDGVSQFSELTDGPRLVKINLASAGSDSWHDRLQHWLGLEGGATMTAWPQAALR